MSAASLLHSVKVLASVAPSGLVFLPTLASRTRASSTAVFARDLLELYARGSIELRPYSGLTPLTSAEARWCIAGIGRSAPLAYVRVRS